MSIKKFLAGLAAFVTVTAAMAQPAWLGATIHVLQSTPPGGATEQANLALQSQLEAAGYRTESVRLGTCKATEEWLRNNPTKSAVFEYLLGNNALHLVDPTHPAACNIALDQRSVLTTNYKSQAVLCSMNTPEQSLARLRQPDAKWGAVENPAITKTIVEGMINDVSNSHRLVRYKGTPALLQALTGREIDFAALVGGGNVAVAAGATCFLVAADTDKAKKMGRTSILEVNPQAKSAGNSGHVSVFVGKNVDVSRIRPVAIKTVNEADAIQSFFRNGSDKVGMPAGQTEDQQWQIVDSYLKSFKK